MPHNHGSHYRLGEALQMALTQVTTSEGYAALKQTLAALRGDDVWQASDPQQFQLVLRELSKVGYPARWVH
jgi:hypothetical protein